MEQQVSLPLLEGIIPEGLRFGANYLVEFEPQSLWYEASLTLCAQALRKGIRTDYHTFTHPPEDIRSGLTRLGINPVELESTGLLRVIDSFTLQTGIGKPESAGIATTASVNMKSLKMSEWDKFNVEILKNEVPAEDLQRLHIDDDTSVLFQYNDEDSVVEHFRTQTVTFARKLKLSAIHAIKAGIYSESSYRRFESFCDGIVDFRANEQNGRMVHSMRVRLARGARHDSTWKDIQLEDDGGVALAEEMLKPKSPEKVDIPFFRDLIPGGIEYGSNLLVEFEPQSCWYEAAYTMAAQALGMGLKTDLHIFQHNPKAVRDAVKRFGLDVKKLEEEDLLRFIDSYSVQVGVNSADVPKGADAFKTSSVKLEDWAKAAATQMSTQIPDSERNRIHIDDNTAILTRYNKEDDLVDYWRTKIIPLYKAREGVLVNAVALGVASDSFYRQHETLADGIIDCKAVEEKGVVEHYIRVRAFRGKSPDTRWRRVKIIGGEVVLQDTAEEAAVSVNGPRGNQAAQGATAAVAMLSEMDELDLDRYVVSGGYMRYDQRARNTLKDLRRKIMTAFESQSERRENFLMWAPPGSGKTFFVRSLGSDLGSGVRYVEVNLAETDETSFRTILKEAGDRAGSTLVFVDEVDSRGNEGWPYEALLTYLDSGENHNAFILAGSLGDSISDMKARIASRPKGNDLLTRIPAGNEFSITGLSAGDRILVFLASVIDQSVRQKARVVEVEKLGLYYVAVAPELSNARRLREFALRCLERLPRGEDRLRYDNMFEPGDPENKKFWVRNAKDVPGLLESFIRVKGEMPERPEERRLAAIMFTDTVGSTALAQRNEALALKLIEDQRKRVRPLLSRYNGREVKTIGDGFLVEFSSTLEAVKCAVAIQAAQKEANDRSPEDRRVMMRIGIHLGDVIHTGADVAGDAVNVASRIESLAPPGGICVTSQVYASVVNKVEWGFEGIGTPELKGVATPIEVYRLAGWGQAGSIPVRARNSPVDRIAVLPFSNISKNRDDDYFADGMTEELISSVSKTQGLRVIARTSVMKYKETSKSIKEIGRELNVGSVLEGSVRKSGDKLRINVQLVETSTEEPKWSEEYDRELKDVFSIQSDIAQKVAGALQKHVLSGSERGAVSTKSTEAYVEYLRGRQAWNKRTEESLKQGIRLFENAIELDANYAKAYSGLADCYATLALLEFMPPREAYPKAKDAAGKAVSIDGRLAEARTSLGLIRFQYDWDWKEAEQEFRKAIEINPNYAPAHHYFADYLKAMGRFDEALQEIEKAQELDPLSLAISAGVGHVLYLSQRNDEAIEQYRKAVELEPNFMQTHVWFGRPYLEKGMYPEALAELETGVRLSGEGTLALAMLGHGLASAGRGEVALAILDRLKERSQQQYVPSYWIAVVYNGMKDRDQVIAWLRKAYEERSSWLVWANVEPRFQWLRNDPDFRSIMNAMKFP